MGPALTVSNAISTENTQMMKQNFDSVYVENVREGKGLFPEAGVNRVCLEEREESGQLVLFHFERPETFYK